MMFRVRLMCIIDGKNIFLVAKNSFVTATFWAKKWELWVICHFILILTWHDSDTVLINSSKKSFFLRFLKKNVLFSPKKKILATPWGLFSKKSRFARHAAKNRCLFWTHIYVLTLHKKNKMFFQVQPPKKLRGGVSQKPVKLVGFWSDRNFCRKFRPGPPKIGRMKMFGQVDLHLSWFWIWIKNIKVMQF